MIEYQDALDAIMVPIKYKEEQLKYLSRNFVHTIVNGKEVRKVAFDSDTADNEIGQYDAYMEMFARCMDALRHLRRVNSGFNEWYLAIFPDHGL